MNLLGTAGEPATRTVGEDRIVAFLIAGGWAYEIRQGDREPAAKAARQALSRWVAAGLPVSTGEGGARRYDPVEVVNFMKWSSLRHGDPIWTERFVTTGRRFVLDLHPEWAAKALPGRFDALPARQFRVAFKRNFNLSSIVPGTPIRLKLPLPLEDARLGNLRIDIDETCDAPVRFSQVPGRLQARLDAPDGGQISLAYHADFTASPNMGCVVTAAASSANDLEPESRALYTRPEEGFIQVTPRIATLARALAGQGGNSLDIAHSFWNYMMDSMIGGAIHYHQIDRSRPMDWLLDIGWYDCELGSALLASLCRAMNIPARIISGHVLYPLTPYYHFWVEIWIDGAGWRPFDLLSSDLSAGGRDKNWRNCFAGAVDYRMKTQCLPRYFVGPMSLHWPSRWRMLMNLNPDGLHISYDDIANGELIYSDDVSVRTGR